MKRWGLAALAWAVWLPPCLASQPPSDPPVAAYQTAAALILDNGHVHAEIDKASASLLSLKYEGQELLAADKEKAPGVWSNHLPAQPLVYALTIDPAKNQGQRAEMSISGKDTLLVDVRYSLARGDHALYVCQILSHPANFPNAVLSRGGFRLRLKPDSFDSLHFGDGKTRDMPTPTDWNNSPPFLSPLARKLASGKFLGQMIYGWDNAALQMDTPVFGFSSTHRASGLWIINPSSEYLGRGGNMIQPTGWLDGRDGTPTLLNWWADDPTADAGLTVGQGESWSRVFGPFLLYCNNGDWSDAKSRAIGESQLWPFGWASKEESLPIDQRATVSGQMVLSNVPLASQAYPTAPPARVLPASMLQNRYGDPTPSDQPTTQPSAPTDLRNLIVGLSPDVDWQSDLMGEQFWVHADRDGKFSIPNVPPGIYVFHAYCDGQFGEAALGGVRVDPGKPLDLHTLTWSPLHYGSFVWQLGFPDRGGAKFLHGSDFSRWGLWTLYPMEFPKDVNYFVGKSDPGKDWNCVQYPGTTWAIHFPLGFVPDQGEGFVRIAIAGGSSGAKLKVFLNNNDISSHMASPLPSINRPIGSVARDDVARDQIRGYYREVIATFPPDDIQLGDNVLRLQVTGHKITDGLIYDCLRLEINATSANMFVPRGPAIGSILGDMPSGMGWDFGQQYKGDPSGDYRSLGRIRRN